MENSNKIIIINNNKNNNNKENTEEYRNKLIIHKFYKNLINNEFDNKVNLRNINNYKKALNIVKKYNYIKDVNELEQYDSIKYLSAKNLCNITFKYKCIFHKFETINNKIFITLSRNNRHIFKIELNDKILLFKEVLI